MEEGKSVVADDGLMLPSSLAVVAAAALIGDRSGKHLIKWLLDNFSSENDIIFKLLHIRPKTTAVPTPMGNLIPISGVREDVAAAYRKEMEWRAAEKLSPYKKMFHQKKVLVDVILIESDDAPNAIADEVLNSSISRLAIEASSTFIFSRILGCFSGRKPKGRNLSSRISECVPSTCTVYVISNGKLRSVRPSTSDRNESSRDERSDTSFSTSNYSSTMNFTVRTDIGSGASSHHSRSSCLPVKTFQALATVKENSHHQRLNSAVSYRTRDESLDSRETEDAGMHCPVNSEIGSLMNPNFSCSNSTAGSHSHSMSLDHDPNADAHFASSSKHHEIFNLELEKLKIELRHVRGMYAVAQNETLDASRKIAELNRKRLEEAAKLKEMREREEKALAIASEEKEKSEAASREAEAAMQLAEREAAQRRGAEKRAISDAKEKEKLENAVTGQVQNYQTFTWEELAAATSSFSKHLEIGRGVNGTVYKCTLRHTAAAVKVLHSDDARRVDQFQKELEILSNVHHPHLLTLLGACPERGCIVYEYMRNGNLQERLQCEGNTPPVHWADRFRIAWEVASALAFLHSSKPGPIVHRDLKPANILLDDNLVSKIGDVGLSTILNADATSWARDTGLVGTLCYIDPEYQRSGIISPKSDVYALGMVILQLLTGRQAMALAHIVETAVMDDQLTEILDCRAGSWPVGETKELALLGLSCMEIRRQDRPELKDTVLPKLEKLKQAAADQAGELPHPLPLKPPAPFICPILKEVMEDPHVAADGYSYDHKAITKWLEETDQSPVTGLPLPHKHLVPNYTLLSAIVEWKSAGA